MKDELIKLINQIDNDKLIKYIYLYAKALKKKADSKK